MSDRILWSRGQRLQSLPLDLPGWPFADGVFRTVLVHAGQAVDLPGQLAHLRADAQRLGLPLGNTDDWSAWTERAAQGHERARLRLMLLRAAGRAGYRPGTQPSELLLDVQAIDPFPVDHYQVGITLAEAELRLAAQPRLAGIKHLNRLEQVMAAATQASDVQELLMRDEQGRPVCGLRSNLFWVRNQVLHTPQLDRCGVAGRLRARVLDAAQALGVSARIECPQAEVLSSAEEVFICNSLIGIWPVRRCLQQTLPAPGPLTQRLSRYLQHPLAPAG